MFILELPRVLLHKEIFVLGKFVTVMYWLLVVLVFSNLFENHLLAPQARVTERSTVHILLSVR